MSGRIKQERAKRLPLPIIGRIKCGEKSEKGFPKSLEYWIADGKYKALFDEAYGEKPTTIQIVFPSDDADLVCKEFYEIRDNAGKLVAEGDGETFKVWSDKAKAYTTLSTNDYPDLMDMIKGKYPKSEWKITLTLNFIIPLVRGVAGLWQFTTKGSASTIPQVRDTFDAMIEQNGHASGVIFDLSVKMHKSNKPNDSSRYPVVTMVANESRANLEMVSNARKPIMIEQ